MTRILVSSAHRAVQRRTWTSKLGKSASSRSSCLVRMGGDVSGALAGPREGEEPIGIVHLQSADGGVTDLVQVCIALPASESIRRTTAARRSCSRTCPPADTE